MLKSTTILSQSGYGSNGNKGVLQNPHISSMKTSPSCSGHSFLEGASYPPLQRIQSMHSKSYPQGGRKSKEKEKVREIQREREEGGDLKKKK